MLSSNLDHDRLVMTGEYFGIFDRGRATSQDQGAPDHKNQENGENDEDDEFEDEAEEKESVDEKEDEEDDDEDDEEMNMIQRTYEKVFDD